MISNMHGKIMSAAVDKKCAVSIPHERKLSDEKNTSKYALALMPASVGVDGILGLSGIMPEYFVTVGVMSYGKSNSFTK